MNERWTECYRIGRDVAAGLPTFSTEDEIARELGLKNKQEAHWRSLVALGKLVIRCRATVKEKSMARGGLTT